MKWTKQENLIQVGGWMDVLTRQILRASTSFTYVFVVNQVQMKMSRFRVIISDKWEHHHLE